MNLNSKRSLILQYNRMWGDTLAIAPASCRMVGPLQLTEAGCTKLPWSSSTCRLCPYGDFL
jgi:hypothetical protein